MTCIISCHTLCLCICSTIPAQIWLVHLSWILWAVVQFLHMLMCCQHCGGWLVCIYICYWNCLCIVIAFTTFLLYLLHYVHAHLMDWYVTSNRFKGTHRLTIWVSERITCSQVYCPSAVRHVCNYVSFTIFAMYLSSLASLTVYSQGCSIDCVSSLCETWWCPCLCTLWVV